MAKQQTLRQVNELLRSGELTRTARDFKHALGVSKSLRQRQAEVVTLDSVEPTCTIKIGGGTEVDGVHYFTCLPCPTYAVWVLTDGEDLFVADSMGPAPSGKLGHTGSPTHTSNGNEQNFDFQNPMLAAVPPDTEPTPDHNGWDWWGMYDPAQQHKLWLPAPGQYRLTANLSFSPSVTGRRYILLKRLDTTNVHAREDEHSLTNTVASMSVTADIRMQDADIANFALVSFQNSGGNLGIVAPGSHADGYYSPSLSWVWQGLASPAGSY